MTASCSASNDEAALDRLHELLGCQHGGALDLRRGRIGPDPHPGSRSDRLARHGTGGRIGSERPRSPGGLGRIGCSSSGLDDGGGGDHHGLGGFGGCRLECHGHGLGHHCCGGRLPTGVTRVGVRLVISRSRGRDPPGTVQRVLMGVESVPDGHHV